MKFNGPVDHTPGHGTGYHRASYLEEVRGEKEMRENGGKESLWYILLF
jgi:hypothetical protein